MPLPLPELPAGCVVITCQANIDGYQPTIRILSPRIVQKILLLIGDAMDYSKTPPAPLFSSLTEALESILDRHLLSQADDRYPDEPDATVAALEAQLEAAKQAARPKFLDPAPFPSLTVSEVKTEVTRLG